MLLCACICLRVRVHRDALMEAQRRASEAEKNFIATKLKEEVDHQLVKDVTEQVEKHQIILEESIARYAVIVCCLQ